MERLRNFNELNHGEHLEQFLALIVPSGSTVDLAQSRGGRLGAAEGRSKEAMREAAALGETAEIRGALPGAALPSAAAVRPRASAPVHQT